MCLGIPGRVESIEGLSARVSFGDVIRETSLDLIADQVSVGDYVLVHAGFALERIDEDEALKTLEILREAADLEAP